MLLAALIARYWKKRGNEADLDMDGKTKFSFIKKLKWELMYGYLWLAAKMHGYRSPSSLLFIHYCLSYFKEEWQ